MKKSLITLATIATIATPVLAQRTQRPATKKPVAAQSSGLASVSLPKLTAEQVLDKSTVASGGAAAIARLKTTTTKGTVSLPAMNINGTMEINSKAPNKFYLRMNLSGIGEQQNGFDGTTAWSKDPISGLRTLTGAEAMQAKAQAEAQAQLSWKLLYSKMEMLGGRKVGNTPCYALKLTQRTGGSVATQYYDAKTFLLLRADAVTESPQGKIPGETYTSDYRVVDGVKMPFKIRQVIAGQQEILITLTEVKNNLPLDDKLFVKPAEEPTKPAKSQ
jgi:zinc protease